jgi:hypothetical protein
MLYVYAVKWVVAGAGPLEYDAHEQVHRRTDLHGTDIVTCDNPKRAYNYVGMARPLARVERPKLLGPVE